MLEPGQIVDRYEVISLLGEGGMAEVYRVRHTRLHSEHALKVLTVSSRGIRSRLIAEGRAQAALQHPNAITVTDVIDVDGAPGLILEYVDGGTLAEWVERSNPSRAHRMKVFEEVCSAVAEAHRRGWVHRDLKPQNVLIKLVGGEPVAKVADFGLVKAVLGDIRDGPRTRGGLPLGTPGFMSPEQIENAAGVDERADVFSLGCLLVWLLTGQSPFEAETVVDSFARVAAGEYDTLDPADPLRGVVERTLHADPGQRYSDAGTLLDALAAPIQRPVRSPRPRTPTRNTTNWVLPAGIAVGAAVFLSAAVAALCVGFSIPGGPVAPAARTDCPLGGKEVIGYVHRDELKIRRGSIQVLAEMTPVLAEIGDEHPRCSLPRGTEIEARESTRFRFKGAWLKVFGDAVQLPP